MVEDSVWLDYNNATIAIVDKATLPVRLAEPEQRYRKVN